MFIPTYAMGFLCMGIDYYGTELPARYIIAVLAGTFILTTIAPLMCIFLMIYKGHITDIYMIKKEERNVPYFIYIFMLLVWCYYIHSTLLMPAIVWNTALATTMVLLFVTLINYHWKISAHLTGMGCLLGSIVTYSWHVGIYPITIIMILLVLTASLMWARLYLNAHTSLQVIAGFGLGLIGALVPLLWV